LSVGRCVGGLQLEEDSCSVSIPMHDSAKEYLKVNFASHYLHTTVLATHT